jgi:hypothetical protein
VVAGQPGQLDDEGLVPGGQPGQDRLDGDDRVEAVLPLGPGPQLP